MAFPPAVQDVNPYDQAWFRRTILLVYLLSLALGADVLYIVPFSQDTTFYKNNFWAIVGFYAIWVSFDLVLGLIFVFCALRMEDLYPGEESLRLRLRWRMTEKAYDILSYGGVFLLLGLSVGWDVMNYKVNKYV